MFISDLTSKQIIRNINLHLLSDIELEEPYISIYNDLKDVFEDLNRYEVEIKTGYTVAPRIYYRKFEDENHIEYEKGSQIIYLDYINIWQRFGNRYKLSNETVQGITTWYAKLALDLIIKNTNWKRI